MELILIPIVLGISVVAFFSWRGRKTAESKQDEWRSKHDVAQTESARAVVLADEKHEAVVRLREENEALREEKNQNATIIGQLKAELKGAQQHAAEKIKILEEAQQKMSLEFEKARKLMGDEFKILSQSILEEKSKKLGEDSEKLLAPLRQNIKEFKQRIDVVHNEDEVARSSLRQQIKDLQGNAAEYGRSADNLARALKGDSKAQGGWGEITLANLLEKSGLREGEEYETQKKTHGEEGNVLRPDVIINLPDGKHLIVDSKVSLRDYHDSTNAEGDEQEAAAARHVQAVKNHVKGLSSKHYHQAKNINSPDFVFMFMPVEPAFFAALKASPSLFSETYDKNIILCAPTTLMAILRTVEHVWKLERQNKNAEDIARRGGLLCDKLSSFLEDMNDVGKALSKAKGSFDAASSKLNTGRGNLIGQAKKLREMGIKGKKELPELGNLPNENLE